MEPAFNNDVPAAGQRLPTDSLGDLLRQQGCENPTAAAILAADRPPLTYAQLWSLRETVARSLAELGLGRNDRIAVVLPDGPELAAAFLTIASCATFAPLNPVYRAEECDFFLTDLRARALVLPAGQDSPARAVAQAKNLPIVELASADGTAAGRFDLRGVPIGPPADPVSNAAVQPDDIALVLHTSGTTSRPKWCR